MTLADDRLWHIATNPKAQNLRSVLMQSRHLWTSGLGRTCSEAVQFSAKL